MTYKGVVDGAEVTINGTVQVDNLSIPKPETFM